MSTPNGYRIKVAQFCQIKVQILVEYILYTYKPDRKRLKAKAFKRVSHLWWYSGNRDNKRQKMIYKTAQRRGRGYGKMRTPRHVHEKKEGV